LFSIQPDGKDFTWHSNVAVEQESLLKQFGCRLSPDAQRIAYPNIVDNWLKLYVKGVGENWPGLDLGLFGQSWCWSSDGTKLAVSVNYTEVIADDIVPQGGDGKKIEHWIVDLKTGAATPLKLSERDMLLDWSADGKWFLTWSWADDPNKKDDPQVNLVQDDGSGRRPIASGRFQLGRFSPDSGKVLLLSRMIHSDKPAQVFVLDLADGKLRQVSPVHGGVLVARRQADRLCLVSTS
jgi:hypothetical protein